MRSKQIFASPGATGDPPPAEGPQDLRRPGILTRKQAAAGGTDPTKRCQDATRSNRPAAARLGRPDWTALNQITFNKQPIQSDDRTAPTSEGCREPQACDAISQTMFMTTPAAVGRESSESHEGNTSTVLIPVMLIESGSSIGLAILVVHKFHGANTVNAGNKSNELQVNSDSKKLGKPFWFTCLKLIPEK